MRRLFLILAVSLVLLLPGALQISAQIQPSSGASAAADSAAPQQIDGVAARIEDDIITESEVRELGAFQELVDGKPETRDQILRELADQWLIRTEASASQYAQPSAADVDRAYAEFVKQYPSAEVFQHKCAAAG